jgi:phosphoglycolate phosphatase-like HAD superfamily hydrolase
MTRLVGSEMCIRDRVKAAKAAGIFCVGYNSEHSKDQNLAEADVVINHFNELDATSVKALKLN